MKKIFFLFFALAVFLFSSALVFSRVDIGEEIQIRSSFYDNITDYDDAKEDRNSYISQRIRFYLEGEIQKDVIARMQMQSIGMWGGV
ncbi:hypothetical protein ACFL4O_01090 [bacterium]